MSETQKSETAPETSTTRKTQQIVDTIVDDKMKQMSEEDLAESKRLEEIVTNNQLNFVEVGNALRKINDKGWFGPHKNLNDFCNAKWGFSGAYGYRHIKAAEVYNHLKQFSPNGEMPLPQNEAQIRPLTKFKKPKKWLKAWKLVVKKAKGGRITEDMVDSIVKNETSGKKTEEKKPTEVTLPANDRAPVVDIHPGEILGLLDDIKAALDEDNHREALKLLGQIELLVKGDVPALQSQEESTIDQEESGKEVMNRR